MKRDSRWDLWEVGKGDDSGRGIDSWDSSELAIAVYYWKPLWTHLYYFFTGYCFVLIIHLNWSADVTNQVMVSLWSYTITNEIMNFSPARELNDLTTVKWAQSLLPLRQSLLCLYIENIISLCLTFNYFLLIGHYMLTSVFFSSLSIHLFDHI